MESENENSVKASILTDISIKSLPFKTAYEQGEQFSTSGLIVYGIYSDGTQKIVNGWKTEPENGEILENTGTIIVKVKIGGCSESFTINVESNYEDNPVVSDSFFWGTWVRMDTGEQYEIYEKEVRKLSTRTSSASRYQITSASASDSISVQTLGTFTKQSDSVIVCDNIPYFRNGGTNLDYSLKIVGFSDSRAIAGFSSRAVSQTSVSGLRGVGKSKTFNSWESIGESTSEGILNLKAPTANDIQTVTLSLTDGSLMVIPDINIANSGDYMGTVAIVDPDQYNLKITGKISDDQKDDGYLYGYNAKTYKMELTITNISGNKCSSSVCTIEPEDSRLSLSSSENLNAFFISTLAAGATKKLLIDLSFGEMEEAFVNTGIKITIRNSKTGQEWSDFVPLRFYKGLIPITVAAKNPENNNQAALNGFIIYPDGNNQFFAVNNNSSKTLFVPSFGFEKLYKIVFSGATVTSTLSESTEMCYSLNPGSSSEKTIILDSQGADAWKLLDGYIKFGGENQSEDSAYHAESGFIGYLSEGEIDYYTINADSEEFYAPGAKSFCKVSYSSEYEEVPSSFYIPEGTALKSEKLPELTHEGMTFLGWYAGDTKVTDGNYEVRSNVTLTAKWKFTDYEIKYELNGGTNSFNNISSYTMETPLFTLSDPTRTGYEFKGWYLNADFTGDKVVSVAGGAREKVTVYAQWALAEYEIIYELNGGNNSSDNITSYTINTALFSLHEPTRSGYDFKGWFTNENFSGDTVEAVAGGSVGKITLYAKWELTRYEIKYELDGGTNDIWNPSYYTVNDKIVLNNPQKTGAFFAGWLLDGEYISGWERNEKTGDLVLTADWVETPVTFYVEVETFSDASIYLELSETSISTTSEFSSYTWFIDGKKVTDCTSNVLSLTSLNLQPGYHTFTLTVLDSDGEIFSTAGNLAVKGIKE